MTTASPQAKSSEATHRFNATQGGWEYNEGLVSATQVIHITFDPTCTLLFTVTPEIPGVHVRLEPVGPIAGILPHSVSVPLDTRVADLIPPGRYLLVASWPEPAGDVRVNINVGVGDPDPA